MTAGTAGLPDHRSSARLPPPAERPPAGAATLLRRLAIAVIVLAAIGLVVATVLNPTVVRVAFPPDPASALVAETMAQHLERTGFLQVERVPVPNAETLLAGLRSGAFDAGPLAAPPPPEAPIRIAPGFAEPAFAGLPLPASRAQGELGTLLVQRLAPLHRSAPPARLAALAAGHDPRPLSQLVAEEFFVPHHALDP